MKLCDSINPVEVYEGRNVDAMPKILADGRIPMNTSQLMKYRISESESFPDFKNYFDVSDLIAYGSKDGSEVKFILTVDKNGKITDNGKKALDLINKTNKNTHKNYTNNY